MRGLLGATLAGGTGWSYAHFIEPGWVELTSISLALPRLAAPFRRYRLVQLSDLHLGDWLDAAHLQGLITLINQQQPDLVAITGDFVTFDPAGVAADLQAQLRRLKARDGVVAVLGNHDHWSDPEQVRQVLQHSGITELRNTNIALERGSEVLHLAGVDDIWAQQDHLEQVLTRLPEQGAAILLAHEPDFADTSAVSGRFDLQLSGHSHGGQVRLPLLGALKLPPYGRKYPMGLYRVGDMLLYTNRGVGMLAPHYRFNCRPEITMFTLETKET
jgi:predicted MPP superfamily phosphohydrolase